MAKKIYKYDTIINIFNLYIKIININIDKIKIINYYIVKAIKEEVITIKYQMPGQCSICGHENTITHFTCTHCQTKTEGSFQTCNFCRLNPEQLEFVEAFLRCRGNIKDVEKELGLSYPTIRNRLEDALQSLGLQKTDGSISMSAGDKKEYSQVLEALANGEVSPQEALRKLKGRK